MLLFLAAIFVVALLSGATAAVAGFGIGSLLTPLLAMRLGMSTAVPAVAIPHFIATALRCWRLRRSIDWGVVSSFGLLSGLGGVGGALLYARFSSAALTIVLGGLLVATSVAVLTNWMRRAPPSRAAAGILGATSGLFGGIAGNQGGLRAGALFAFPLSPAAFVATSTAVGVLVDIARVPIYLSHAGATLRAAATPIAVATIGVVIGTLAGERVLRRLGIERFRKAVALLIGALGLWLIASAW